jgi:two-component system, cell cycle sensor histidine kinase and response regulator CckA
MAISTEKCDQQKITELQREVQRLKERLKRQKNLQIRLNETLHNLNVHQEELRTQNEDLNNAQKELFQSQRKYLNLFDFAPIGYFLINTNGELQEINLVAARMIDRSRKNAGGKPLFIYVEPAYRPAYERHLRSIWAGESSSAEVVLVQKDGRRLPVELFSIPVSNEAGRIVQARIAATDISKRWQAEEELKASESRLQTIIKTIPDIVYRLDQNGLINFISESIRRYGYRPDEVLGSSMMHLVHPEDRTMAKHHLDERRTGDRSTSGLELRLLIKAAASRSDSDQQQEVRYFLVNAEGLYTDSSEPDPQFIGTQGIAHDITKRKHSENEHRNLEAQLHKARKMEAIGTLAGGIAHDFNNLLMGIQGNTSLMRMDHPDDEQSQQRLESIEQCVKRGSELTKQLLGFAKRGKYAVKTVDINEIVSDSVQLFARTHKAIKIGLELNEELWAVDADRGQLEQVLLNLLINADQAMPDGGHVRLGTQNAHSSSQQLHRLGLNTGRYVRILIEDTGVGMEADILTRIFEPFFTTKAMGRGTGLGLASAYGIVKNHGGIIDVESTPGRGSRFSVFLPASDGAVTVESKRHQGVLKGRGTILLIDDEEFIIDVGSDMLKSLGYHAVCARDGREAVQIYTRRHAEIDLVILDMIMPEMSGFETYNELKSINPHIKVLLASGYSQKWQASDIIARDGQTFIQKPFDLARLSHMLHAILLKPPPLSE